MIPTRVLVTGVYGLIRSTLYLSLKQHPDRYEVFGLDRHRRMSDRVPEGRQIEIPDDRFYACDLLDAAGIADAVAEKDVVVHLAGDPQGLGWESLLHNNLIGAYHTFEACKQAGVKRIVTASTYLVSQGYAEQEPYTSIVRGRLDAVTGEIPVLTADMATRPRDLYAATKIWKESLAQVYHSETFSCICIRIGGILDEPGPRGDVWCSPRDLVQLITRCIDAPTDIRFDIFYAMSDNRWRWVDIEHARRRVGYAPQDSAENFASKEPHDA
ncbi:MAG: NAD(P)-dependent oxidoreductase [candidate division Zixibacteria bacterium]|nr:NAD(P)-dependent oxidoreductase [candidate division Zixibacteria bacterium]